VSHIDHLELLVYGALPVSLSGSNLQEQPTAMGLDSFAALVGLYFSVCIPK